jgi:co-chaperonin GroES (HSP10)
MSKNLNIQKVKRNAMSTKVGGNTVIPLNDNVLVTDMSFEYRVTAAGIILPPDDGKDSGIRPRWAKIYAVGPLQTDPELVPGKYILISHGRWTRGIDLELENGEKMTIRKVDLNEILLVSDEPVHDETISDKAF